MVNMNRSSRKPIGLPLELCSPRQTPKGLSKKKHDHLLMLLQWILEAFHDFYKNIPVLGQQGDDDDDVDCIYILQMSFFVIIKCSLFPPIVLTVVHPMLHLDFIIIVNSRNSQNNLNIKF
ncbi:unnamed protein product [Acanthoscelides obtectus]|uniref:Uncharacterized protein n=1 Tax=Acanthoscelides obtectus TaxID=200917 RepID=A0A9P0KSW3_ACAOB|nr:unnamed protein product [Acanthoscelides obtectus]CAK1656192.1 hypothetical protein AOBTE_LOCUS19608 [Acanthoscelides obtectus]